MSAGRADVTTITAVYAAVEPAHLREALDSVRGQTLRPREVIVVADGPLTDELERVLDEAGAFLPMTLLRMSRQSGSGLARQMALEAASTNWVAIVDADDVSLQRRLEAQVAAAVDQSLAIVGTAVEEFDAETQEVLGVRAFAADTQAIKAQLRTRNAFNHPSVLMSRKLALDVGGYRHLPFLEDYDLCARIAASGARMSNLQDALVRFRGGAPSQRRRRTAGWLAAEVQLQRNLRRYGLIPIWRIVPNLVVRSTFRLLPSGLGRIAYSRIFLARQDREG